MADITRTELMNQIAAMGNLDKETRAKVVCAPIGHSGIMTYCFGYWSCGRCDAQIGDSLAGSFDGSKKVLIGHACKQCRANYKAMTWQDKLYVPNPFPKKKAA